MPLSPLVIVSGTNTAGSTVVSGIKTASAIAVQILDCTSISNSQGGISSTADGLTVTGALHVSGLMKSNKGLSTSTTDSVQDSNSSSLILDRFREPHGAGAFIWLSAVGEGTATAAEV